MVWYHALVPVLILILVLILVLVICIMISICMSCDDQTARRTHSTPCPCINTSSCVTYSVYSIRMVDVPEAVYHIPLGCCHVCSLLESMSMYSTCMPSAQIGHGSHVILLACLSPFFKVCVFLIVITYSSYLSCCCFSPYRAPCCCST